jgi:predicted phosphodiesterase
MAIGSVRSTETISVAKTVAAAGRKIFPEPLDVLKRLTLAIAREHRLTVLGRTKLDCVRSHPTVTPRFRAAAESATQAERRESGIRRQILRDAMPVGVRATHPSANFDRSRAIAAAQTVLHGGNRIAAIGEFAVKRSGPPVTDFRFLHAADIHLDSPLHGLSRYEGLPVPEIRGATRAAFDNLVQLAMDERVDFVLIAGDLFDGDWRDMGTGLYFARAMGRLDQAGIPVFILSGNHDAASVVTRTVPWPPNVRQFGSKRPQTHTLPAFGVAIHGQSFATPAVTENLVLAYPHGDPHMFNIGMLHTALAGRTGHADYAPCSVDDLRAKGYDYWALGHVHAFEIASTDPHVVFPGNIQGRTIRETGPKGAVIVSVSDRAVTSVERVDLDVIRWFRAEVDCTGAEAEDVTRRIRTALTRIHGENGSGLPLVVRISLVGQTAAAGALHDRASGLRDDARAIATSISADLHVEKVKVLVAEPAGTRRTVGDDLSALIDEAPVDPGLAQALDIDLAKFMLAVQTSLGPPEDGELRLSAAAGDWPAVLRTAAIALRARLTGEA